MASSTIEHLTADLSRLAPDWKVREVARDCVASRRRGRVDNYALLMTVVLGWAWMGFLDAYRTFWVEADEDAVGEMRRLKVLIGR